MSSQCGSKDMCLSAVMLHIPLQCQGKRWNQNPEYLSNKAACVQPQHQNQEFRIPSLIHTLSKIPIY
ncbi:hypothetical protein I79_003365 [Cricetulus griseus]|uniref:Uncharacterized protein n=1 Tax=Cricetulus griseus TaxID=10029 RepID=G3GZR9_CRIGR|nr:hypothetical protein I79_003365 [Cricetulus griseus]